MPTPRPQPLTWTWAWQSQQYYTDSSKRAAVDIANLQPGQSAWIVLTAKNTGTATWSSTGQYPLLLGTGNPENRTSAVATDAWYRPNRPARMRQASVAPGQSATFEFPIRVPGGPSGGTYREHFNLVAEGLTWLNDPGFYIEPRALSYTWEPAAQQAYTERGGSTLDLAHLRPGQTGWLVVRARNTGTATWRQDGPTPVLLGTNRPRDRSSAFATPAWHRPNRPALLNEATVPPGGIGTFEFPIQTPLTGGAYTEAFNLVANGLTWFNDPGLHYRMTVVPVAGIAANPTGRGYWLTAADGGVFAHGGAPFAGSAAGAPLNRPVVGMAATPSGGGYWLVGADGGVFAYGDARFHGSPVDRGVRTPVVGITATGTGGYSLVTSAGEVFGYTAPPPPPANTTDRLDPNAVLGRAGRRLVSSNGQYVLLMQDDGNLVEYAPGNRPIWASNTAGNPGTVLVNQADGNIVLVAPGNRPIWATNTAGNPGTVLLLKNDANLVAYAPGNRPVWASGTRP